VMAPPTILHVGIAHTPTMSPACGSCRGHVERGCGLICASVQSALHHQRASIAAWATSGKGSPDARACGRVQLELRITEMGPNCSGGRVGAASELKWLLRLGLHAAVAQDVDLALLVALGARR
jgi:hypothetical protein